MEATASTYRTRAGRRRFDPRLRDGGDAPSTAASHTRSGFDPRLRDGGDAAHAANLAILKGFDPRLRDGGDQEAGAAGIVMIKFRSTPP